jgi:hypothetical protein
MLIGKTSIIACLTVELKDHCILARHEGANHQRVQVPSGKLTVHEKAADIFGCEETLAQICLFSRKLIAR